MCQEVFDLLTKRREKYPNECWVFPSPVKPGDHIKGVRTSHDRICERIGLRGVIDLYTNLRASLKSPSPTMGKIRGTLLKRLVGAPGFEPGASCAQGRRATRLRYAPT
jgi:hypothetical protein